MRAIHWLAILPFLGLIVGPFFVDGVQPFVLGLPLLLGWIVAWVVLTAIIMAIIYGLDAREDAP